jgi:GTP-binding protein
MPGYGFAKAPKPQVDAWTRLIHSYLKGRATLRRVYVLIDARHGLKSNDETILSMLDKSAVSYQIILTKADKIREPALQAVLSATAEKIRKRPAAYPDVLATSSEKKSGLDALRDAIATVLTQ